MLIIKIENLWVVTIVVLLLLFILNFYIFFKIGFSELSFYILPIYYTSLYRCKRLSTDYIFFNNHVEKWLNGERKSAVLAHFKALNICFKT